jgi:polyribonucleotide nucleotidyltransferase
MDFKVAGTKKGITGIQMDIKLDGISVKILKEALVKAEAARLHILGVMEKEIAAPRADISPKAPKIITTKVKVDQIGLVIGTGGKTIKEMMEKSGARRDYALATCTPARAAGRQRFGLWLALMTAASTSLASTATAW